VLFGLLAGRAGQGRSVKIGAGQEEQASSENWAGAVTERRMQEQRGVLKYVLVHAIKEQLASNDFLWQSYRFGVSSKERRFTKRHG